MPGLAPDWYRERLDLMLAFVGDYTRPDGLAPQVGDADDGRFLPLGDYGADPRDHRHLFGQAGRSPEQAAGSAAYPRRRLLRPAARQPVRARPLRRRRPRRPRGHAHNDQLSFELSPTRGRSSSTPAPTSTPPIRSSETASARPRPTPRSTSSGASRTSPHGRPLLDGRPDARRGALVGHGVLRGPPPRLPGRDPHAPDRARRARAADPRTRSRAAWHQELERTFPLRPGAEERVEISRGARVRTGARLVLAALRRPGADDVLCAPGAVPYPGEDVTEISRQSARLTAPPSSARRAGSPPAGARAPGPSPARRSRVRRRARSRSRYACAAAWVERLRRRPRAPAFRTSQSQPRACRAASPP